MYPNIQAYDRGVMFSPDGRLFQVEYAKEAVKKGATTIGMLAEDSVIFVAHKDINAPLAIPSSLQKVFRVDSYIGATYSGMASDGLRIINMMRNKTQTHRMIYDETQSVETVARDISEEMQMATQYGGLRPYAISLLIGGIDTKPRLFEVDPGAAFLGYRADAIGVGKKAAEETLIKEYKDDIKIGDAISLAVGIIAKLSDKKLVSDNVEIATIDKKSGYATFTMDQISKYL
ncbi:archaeal proteasome endopeptidase complex subunit alpha [Candidatus Marsarchaeota archaeon]|jgi:proteasome alpha subunit|nr:archaeal proteasome endopeptidase complex subunit alpha [Candidatus Marsarchaeota archaeon]